MDQVWPWHEEECDKFGEARRRFSSFASIYPESNSVQEPHIPRERAFCPKNRHLPESTRFPPEPRGDDEEIEGLGVQGRRAAIGA